MSSPLRTVLPPWREVYIIYQTLSSRPLDDKGASDRISATAVTSDRRYLARHEGEIKQAARRIRDYVRHTPVLVTDLNANLVLKPECLQLGGSFKVRGAFNAVLRLVEAKTPIRGVVTISSGNHAKALAMAARAVHLPAVILIPEDANPAKVAATRALGAEVIQDGVTFLNREQRLREVIAERGLTLVHPFDDWDVIHGQGTAALELFGDRPDISVVVAPISGGGLMSGTALAAKARRPGVVVVGVEPAVGDDALRSMKSQHIERLNAPPVSLADGARALSIGEKTFEVMIGRQLVDQIVTVSEREIQEAVVTSWLELKLVMEPTAALPLAAYMHGKVPTPTNGKTALIISGGNVDPAVVTRLLEKG